MPRHRRCAAVPSATAGIASAPSSAQPVSRIPRRVTSASEHCEHRALSDAAVAPIFSVGPQQQQQQQQRRAPSAPVLRKDLPVGGPQLAAVPPPQQALDTPVFRQRSDQGRGLSSGSGGGGGGGGGGVVSLSTRERQLLQSLARLDAELWAKQCGSHDAGASAVTAVPEEVISRQQDEYAIERTATAAVPLVQVPVRSGATKGELPYKPRVRRPGR